MKILSFLLKSYGTVYTTLIALEGSNLREDNAASRSPLMVGLWEQVHGTHIIEKFAPRAYYFASSSKNKQLLKQLDETIRIIGQVQPSLQDVLFDKFFRNTRYIFSPTDQQKEYLSSIGTL